MRKNEHWFAIYKFIQSFTHAMQSCTKLGELIEEENKVSEFKRVGREDRFLSLSLRERKTNWK